MVLILLHWKETCKFCFLVFQYSRSICWTKSSYYSVAPKGLLEIGIIKGKRVSFWWCRNTRQGGWLLVLCFGLGTCLHFRQKWLGCSSSSPKWVKFVLCHTLKPSSCIPSKVGLFLSRSYSLVLVKLLWGQTLELYQTSFCPTPESSILYS